jgi:hypothetical protein
VVATASQHAEPGIALEATERYHRIGVRFGLDIDALGPVVAAHAAKGDGRLRDAFGALDRAVTHPHGAEREPLLDTFLRQHVVPVQDAVARNHRVRHVERPRPQPRDHSRLT